MKWGRRRTDAQLAASKGESSTTTKTASDGDTKIQVTVKSAPAAAKKPSGNIQDNVESSSARYARLAGVAKSGNASSMTEQDLKFFNGRTEALSKINKMNETKPGWLQTAVKNTAQNVAEQQMRKVASGLADKYISGPMLAQINRQIPAADDDD